MKTTSYTQHNVVHSLMDKPSGKAGLEVKCNWRYWGIAISWGDSLEWPKDGYSFPVWFIGSQIGPLFVTWSWLK